MPLTDAAVRNAKATDKTLRLKDERGLYLEVNPKGGKWWRLRYWLASKENRLSLHPIWDMISRKTTTL